MKQSKNDIALLDLITKIQAQLSELDKKIDTLVFRSLSENKQVPKPSVNNAPSNKPNEQNRERVMHQAICADCKKECTIPFKPSGDRPVYCKDCFSRRKVISMSGMKVDLKPVIVAPEEPKIKKKKAPAVKKPIAKKKLASKKK